MTDPIITSVISGLVTIIVTVITVLQTNNKTNITIEKKMAVMDTKLETLTNEVRRHNDFAQRIPVTENDIRTLYHYVDEIRAERNTNNGH